MWDSGFIAACLQAVWREEKINPANQKNKPDKKKMTTVVP
jgi:hypothetical protein